jgi:hypothetical protein
MPNIDCTAIVPVSKLKLPDEAFSIGRFTYVPPVVEGGFQAVDHPQAEYWLTNPAAFRGASEYPLEDLKVVGEKELLLCPLVQCPIRIESDLLTVPQTLENEIALIRHASDAAERGLDVLRFAFCHYKRPEYLPNLAGDLADGFSCVYLLMNGTTGYRDVFAHQIARPLRASNNWLGLEVDEPLKDPQSALVAASVGGDANTEIAERAAGALRTAGQAFYTIHDEARFLSLVFALEALVEPKQRWNRWAQRAYVAAAVSTDPCVFRRQLESFDCLYTDVRNKLVHGGETFVTLGVNPMSTCQQIYLLLMKGILSVLESNHTGLVEFRDEIEQRARSASFTSEISAVRQTRGQTTPGPNW